ncbi:MAG: hypothetical protein Q9207_002741 [Kuettlingeria erythrocarpa]
MARACLQYLNHQEFSFPCEWLGEDDELEKRISRHPLLGYACTFWGDHASDAGKDDEVDKAVAQYLQDPGKVAAFTQAAWYLNSESLGNWDIRKGANGLHIAAWFGLTEAIRSLLGHGLDVNAQDPAGGRTPLMLACRRGHASTTTLLLEEGAFVNTRDSAESTALFEAIDGDHSEVVDALLRRPELNVNEEYLYRAKRTSLVLAVTEDFVKILADHSAIVTQLLNAGVDLSIKDQDGGTALSRAIDRGHTATVKIMLDQDNVDVSIRDHLLIGKGFDKDARDSNGRTPLHRASRTGEAGVVSLLLAARANKNIKDRWSRSIWDVAWTNRQAEVMLLLESKTADDTSTQSLLENYPNMDNLPIWSLANFGQIDIVNNAIRNRPGSLFDLDPDTDNTALHSAVVADKPQILETLLAEGLSPNARNTELRTPLHLATALDFQGCTQVLLASFSLPDPTFATHTTKHPFSSPKRIGSVFLSGRICEREGGGEIN